MLDYQHQDIPEGLPLDSVIRIGHVITTVRTFVRIGMLRQEGSKFIKTHDRHIMSTDPAISKPDPFSLRELQKRGFKVIAGKTEANDLVRIPPGIYCRIRDALKNGLVNETTQPM